MIEVDPASVDFGVTAPSVSVVRMVNITNGGSAPLNVAAITITGSDAAYFKFTRAGGDQLLPGARMELQLTYLPSTTGAHAARLLVESDASNTVELALPLTGVSRTLDLCDGITCNVPPSSCHREGGACAGGSCSYLPKADGSPCDDGNACTETDACLGGTCRGTAKTCETAPAPMCTSATDVRVYATPGQCVAGACQYPVENRACANGCAAGQCVGDPCAGVVCAQRSCFLPGTCAGGTCSYQPDIGASCDDGLACTDNDACGATGACVGSLRSCSTPPAPSCVDANTQRTFTSTGTCISTSGACQYASSDLSCALGCDSATGRCRSSCSAGTHLCGAACVPDTSVSTCGTSCVPCPVPSNGASTCMAGLCGFSCNMPFVPSGSSCTTWQQKAYLKASNTGAGDAFGWFTGISGDGNLLVVIANQEDSAAQGIGGSQSSNTGTDSGAAYVFRRVGGVWVQEAYVKTSNAEAGDRLSSVTVSADGTAFLVGAWGESSSSTGVGGSQTNNTLADSGAAYLFRRNTAGSWVQEAYFKASNPAADDRFATGLAINADGTVVAIGARNEDSAAVNVGGSQSSNAAVDSGAVYVFRKTASTWAQEAYVKQSNTGANDQFGLRVDLSNDGNVLVVGAWAEDSNGVGVNGTQANESMADSGAAYVYRRSTAGVWASEAYLKASNTNAGDWFGMAVAISGDGSVIAIGARNESSGARGIGANQADNSAPGAGAVYVFRYAGAWTQESYLKAANADAGDYFGWTIGLSLDGSVMAVGAYRESSASRVVNGDSASNAAPFSGAAYVFRKSASTWSQEAYLKAANADGSDEFGWSVSLSDDGATVAVSGVSEDSAATGINPVGTDNSSLGSGAVYVF